MAFFDFEDGLVPSGWTQRDGSEKSWIITSSEAYEGTYSLRADEIPIARTAGIIFTVENCIAGDMTFYVKVDCRFDHHFFHFYIDGDPIFDADRTGEVDWELISTPITEGTHTFAFLYYKDNFAGVRSDTAWVDNITVPVYVFPAADLTLTPLSPSFSPALVPAVDLTLTPLSPSFSPALVPAVDLTLTPLNLFLSLIQAPFVDLSLTAVSPAPFGRSDPDSAALTLTALNPSLQFFYPMPAASLALAAQALSVTLAPPRNAVLRTVFRVYLTATGYADLELPCRSFQARNRLTTRNYLAVVVPDPLPYIDAIQERSSGRIVVKSGFALADDTEVLTELTSAVFDSFRYDLGPFNGSATLIGYDYRTPGAPLTRPVRGISFRGMSNSGARRVRCEPDMYLKPGDTADLGDGETLVIEQIAYTISARQATMEISEAEPGG
jgi:hypothetical protein